MAKNKKSNLFRKTSLEKLSSPEQLDVLVRITTPAGWIVLSTLAGLIIVALIWGIFGSIPTKVKGSCVLIRTGGVYAVSANAPGRVSDIAVSVGDMVKQGQPIARVSQPELLDQFHNLKLKKDELEVKNKQRFALQRQKRTNLEEQISILKQKIQAQEQLLHDGLITKQSLLTTKQTLAETRSQLKQLHITNIEYADQLDSIKQQMAGLRQKLQLSTDVVSPYTGRVVQVNVDDGTMINAGTPILEMELYGNAIMNLTPVIYVSALDGKKVKPGMQVLIAPSTVKTQDYGYMLGNITRVADYPATQQGMMRILQNHDLVNELTKGSASLEINANLIPSLKTQSGFKWTSPGGPPTKIQSGTLCTAKITVNRQRPISLVIPAIKKFLGV